MNDVRTWSEEEMRQIWADAKESVRHDLPLLIARRRRAEKRKKQDS